MTLAAIDADDVDIRILLKIAKHLFIDILVDVCIGIEYNGNMEEVFWFRVSSILDNLMIGFFDNNLVDI